MQFWLAEMRGLMISFVHRKELTDPTAIVALYKGYYTVHHVVAIYEIRHHTSLYHTRCTRHCRSMHALDYICVYHVALALVDQRVGSAPFLWLLL